MKKSVNLQDVLDVLEQNGPIDIRVRMAKILLKKMIEEKVPTDEDYMAALGPCGK
jgi:hypothetical protein